MSAGHPPHHSYTHNVSYNHPLHVMNPLPNSTAKLPLTRSKPSGRPRAGESNIHRHPAPIRHPHSSGTPVAASIPTIQEFF